MTITQITILGASVRGVESDPELSCNGRQRWDPDLQPLLGFEPFEELIRPKG